MEYIISFIVAGIVFAVIDAVWLKSTKSFYAREFGAMLLAKPKLVPAIMFYIIYILGLVLFVLVPALRMDSWHHALFYGALFGLVTYATYDLTNLATLKNWSSKVTIIDIVWGSLVTAVSSVITYFILNGMF